MTLRSLSTEYFNINVAFLCKIAVLFLCSPSVGLKTFPGDLDDFAQA